MSLTIASYRVGRTATSWRCELTCGRDGCTPRWIGKGDTREAAIDHAAAAALSYWTSTAGASEAGQQD